MTQPTNYAFWDDRLEDPIPSHEDPHKDRKVYRRLKHPILSRYTTETHYHGIDHAEFMIRDCEIWWDSFVRSNPDSWYEGHEDPDRVQELCLLAILFHDIVYVVGAEDNEERSAEEAEKVLKDQLPQEEIDIVKQHILYTKLDAKEGLISSKFIRDLDWMGFADYEIFVRIDWLLLNEALAAGHTREQFIEGRIKFLQHLIDEEAVIFRTGMFKGLNDRANKNIRRRIKELQG